jgi:hypothetical protein
MPSFIIDEIFVGDIVNGDLVIRNLAYENDPVHTLPYFPDPIRTLPYLPDPIRTLPYFPDPTEENLDSILSTVEPVIPPPAVQPDPAGVFSECLWPAMGWNAGRRRGCGPNLDSILSTVEPVIPPPAVQPVIPPPAVQPVIPPPSWMKDYVPSVICGEGGAAQQAYPCGVLFRTKPDCRGITVGQNDGGGGCMPLYYPR